VNTVYHKKKLHIFAHRKQTSGYKLMKLDLFTGFFVDAVDLLTPSTVLLRQSRLSVRDVEISWSLRLEFFQINYTIS